MGIRKNRKENWFDQKKTGNVIERQIRLGACVGGSDMYWEWVVGLWPLGDIKDWYGNIYVIKSK